jgi:hypothetical protein
MSKDRPVKGGYPDAQTGAVVKFCEAVGAIEAGDFDTLTRHIKDASTEMLLGGYEYYEDRLDAHYRDAEGCPFSVWDHEVRQAVYQELNNRGLRVLPRNISDELDKVTTDPKRVLH